LLLTITNSSINFFPLAAGSLRRRQPARSPASRPVRLLPGPHRGKNQGVLRKLRGENIITSLRENKIRVSPYIYNNERDIDRLISVVTI